MAPVSAPDDVLRVEHISKSFGPTTALRDVNLHLRKGEILGLLGDNGSGKSTLIKIICGFQKQDGGQMFLHGEPYEPKSVDDARAHGIDTVYQDLALVDELSVYHNMFLRRERVHLPIPFLDNALMRNETRKALDEIGINIPRLDVPVARLSGGQRQAIAVARTVSGEANILLLDEPLAAMGAKEGGMILELIDRLKEEGEVSMMIILHNYVHVLRDVRPREPAPGRRDRAGQAGGGDLRRGAERDRRRGVPPRAPGGDRGGDRGKAGARGHDGPPVSRPAYALGVDFGTESGRALLLDLRTGEEAARQRGSLRARRDRPRAAVDRRAAAARLGAPGPR